MTKVKALLLTMGLLTASTSLMAAPAASVSPSQGEVNRQLVVNFYNQFFNQHDTNAAKVVIEGYRQHNPQVPDGKQPFVSYFKDYFKQHPQSHAQIIRSAVDGDLVW